MSQHRVRLMTAYEKAVHNYSDACAAFQMWARVEGELTREERADKERALRRMEYAHARMSALRDGGLQ